MSKYTITVSIPDRIGSTRVEPILRLRQWLKTGLRRMGIRCIDVRPADQPETGRGVVGEPVDMVKLAGSVLGPP